MNKPKGSILLLVVGILMIVGAALSLGLTLFASAFVGVFGDAIQQAGLGGAAKGFGGAVAIAVVVAAVELFAGILGIAFRNAPRKANILVILGVFLAAASVASGILPAILAKQAIQWGSMLLGLVLPALYIVGAILNKGGR